MDREKLFDDFADICREMFDDDQLEVTCEMCRDDIDGWDSLTHISLISALEDEYGVKFTLDEISGDKSIGDIFGFLCSRIEDKA